MAPMSILLAALTLISVTLIEAPSHHVQGIDVDGGVLWVTSVDRATRAGFLTRYDLASGRRLATVEVQTIVGPSGTSSREQHASPGRAHGDPSGRAGAEHRRASCWSSCG